MDTTVNPPIDERHRKKAADFHRITAPRVQMVIDVLRRIGNCGDRGRYAYTESERTKMFRTIRAAVDAAEAEYDPPYKDKERFSF